MKSVDIYEKRWIDLVFEGKNQSYGAYQLRRDSSKTTIRALFYGIFLIGGFAGILTLSSFVGDKPATVIPKIIDVAIRPVRLNPTMPKMPKASVPISKPATPKKFFVPVVVTPNNADPEIPKTTSATTTPSNPTSGTETNTGTATTISTMISGSGTIPANPGTITNTAALDKLPEFPGGITKFYTYVGNNFGKTEIGDEKTIRIYVSFVIEKDGSMTDIKVPKDPGFGLGNEAIRVLKSLKTKWQPGLISGQAVRTAYSLPITVQTD